MLIIHITTTDDTTTGRTWQWGWWLERLWAVWCGGLCCGGKQHTTRSKLLLLLSMSVVCA